MLGGCFLTFIFFHWQNRANHEFVGFTKRLDMTSPLKQMAQFWSNYTPWKKLTLCTSKNWHLGRQSFLFFVIRPIFKGESCWLYEGYLDGVAAQQSSFEAPRNCSNDTKGTRRSRNGAFPATSLITRPCIPIGTTFFIAICMTRSS